jgi:acetylornithine/succinyldiaminopimelate/putrescine aminotransferase
LPEDLGTIYFTNSGAEAIEGAMKTARKFTRRSKFVAFDGAYHGDTLGALALAGNAEFRSAFEPLPGPVLHLPYDDLGAPDAIDDATAAVVVEPVQAEGGVRIPRREFLHALRQQCDRADALLVFDEVLTGFGRIGKLFALEHFEVVPDIVVLAKALGGGLPLGAFCSSNEILACLAHDPPLGHITTFGGHPLSCAAALAALEETCSRRLWDRAASVGAQLLNALRLRLGNSVEVRGLGLLVGIEFANAAICQRFVEATISRGVIVNWTLNADRVARLAPPLTISADEIEFAVAAMVSAISEIA